MSEQNGTEQQSGWTESSVPNVRNWLLGLGALALIVVGVNSLGGGSPTSAQETVSPAGIDEIVVNVQSASVSISEGSSRDIQVSVNTTGSAADQLIVRERGNQLEIELMRRPWSFSFWSFSGRHLNVTLPAGFTPDLNATAVSGGVTLDGLSLADLDLSVRSGRASLSNLRVAGDARTETRSGDLDIRRSRISGDLHALTRSGGLSLEATEARTYTFETHSGGITATGLSGGPLTASVRSGRMNLEASALLADWNLSARSGGVNVSFDQVPQPFTVEFDGRSGSWNVADRYGLAVDSSDSNQMRASSGNGGPVLHVETRSGGFRLD